MGPPSYKRSVVDRNVVMRRMTVQKCHCYDSEKQLRSRGHVLVGPCCRAATNSIQRYLTSGGVAILGRLNRIVDLLTHSLLSMRLLT